MNFLAKNVMRQCAGRLVRRNFATEVASDLPLKLTFAAINQVFYSDVTVQQVDVPSFSGYFGVLAKHVPTFALLKPGVVTVLEADNVSKKYFVSSGTVTINDDSTIQVLAEEACRIEDIAASELQSILQQAQTALSSASTDEAREEAAVAVEVAEALTKAVE